MVCCCCCGFVGGGGGGGGGGEVWSGGIWRGESLKGER